MKGRDFLKLLDFTQEEILQLIDLAAELKQKKKALQKKCFLCKRATKSSVNRGKKY